MMTTPGGTAPAAAATFETASERGVATLRMLVDADKSPRLAMVGTSMLPLLRVPMVLELGPVHDRARVGDVLVFVNEGRLWAHRVVGFHQDVHLTAGDNNPWRLDRVRLDRIIGRVVAVYGDDRPGAKRVDDYFFRTRGYLNARTRALRALGHLAASQVRRVPRGLNAWRRPRPFVALVRAMTAIVEEDKSDLVAALSLVDQEWLLATVRRHSCAGLLLQGMGTLGIDESSNEVLVRGLRASTRAVVLKVLLLRNQIAALVATLRNAKLDFVLLKGAARIYAGADEAYLHRSSDIDILVRREDVDAASAALLAVGYRQRVSAKAAAWYRAHHHHVAPLVPADGGVPVELHLALAPPGAFSQTLDWNTLSKYFRTIDGPAGEARALNDLGAAIHLASHSTRITRLRDIFVVAQLLRRMDSTEVVHLKHFVDREQVEQVRLGAVVAMASQLGGVDWDESPAVRRYLDWILRREDLPALMRRRSHFVDTCYATVDFHLRLEALLSGIQLRRSKHRLRNAVFAPLRLTGRLLISAAACLYANAFPTAFPKPAQSLKTRR